MEGHRQSADSNTSGSIRISPTWMGSLRQPTVNGKDRPWLSQLSDNSSETVRCFRELLFKVTCFHQAGNESTMERSTRWSGAEPRSVTSEIVTYLLTKDVRPRFGFYRSEGGRRTGIGISGGAGIIMFEPGGGRPASASCGVGGMGKLTNVTDPTRVPDRCSKSHLIPCWASGAPHPTNLVDVGWLRLLRGCRSSLASARRSRASQSGRRSGHPKLCQVRSESEDRGTIARPSSDAT